MSPMNANAASPAARRGGAPTLLAQVLSLANQPVLWLAPETITQSGGSLTGWTGYQSTVYDADVGLAAPAYNASEATLNGQACATFAVGTDQLVVAGGITENIDECTFFFVYKSNSTSDANQHLLRNGVGGIVYAANPSSVLGYYDGVAHRSGEADILGAQQVGLQLSGVEGQFRRNGAALGAALTYDGTFNLGTNLYIGNDAGGTGDLIADLAEVLVFDAAISAADITLWEAYLADKYGL